MQLYIILTILFVIFLILFIKFIKTKNSKITEKNGIITGPTTYELKDNKRFILQCHRIKKGKLYYIAVNKATKELFLTQNESLAEVMTLENVIESDASNMTVLKCKNGKYIGYVYPYTYSDIYEIKADNNEANFNTYLQFNLNMKYEGFTLKYDNLHYIVYDPDTLKLYTTKTNKLKKLLVKIKEIKII